MIGFGSLLGTLWRYIAMRFIISIFGAYLLCASLIYMIDILELLRQAGKHGSIPLTELLWMSFLRVPAYAELTLPFATLVGSISAFLLLSRSSELTIARASGMSAWQFIAPGVIMALLIGLFSIIVYNPMAASARAQAETLYAKAFGKKTSLLKTKGGLWLRQDGSDGQSIINALASAEQGMKLTGVTVLQYDRKRLFLERIEAKSASLNDGFWNLSDAWVTRPGQASEFYKQYILSTYLTRTQVTDALGSIISISFWDLPKFIALSQKAGLSATKYKVQYQLLLVRPIQMVVMVFLAATVSLRTFRFGGIQTMIITGMIAGFGFFILAEVSRQVGISGLTPPMAAAWVPVAIVLCLSITVLLHQEDG